MTKVDLITNIIDYIERAEYSDDYDEELFNQMNNYLHTLYIGARVDERTQGEARIDEIRKYYYGIVENLLCLNADKGFVSDYDNIEEIEYKLTFDDSVNDTMKVGLFIGSNDNIIEDYIIVDDFLPMKDKIDAIVEMIMFDKYC
jgi:hypothetical protein